MTIHRGLAALVFCVLICTGDSYSSEQDGKQSLENDIAGLYSSNAKTRADAATRLATVGTDAIPLLVPVICDKAKPDFDVAWPSAAKILGELKAEAAAPCLIQMLMSKYPSIGPVVMKPDETLARADPAFAALVQIGEPAVPAIRKRLPFLGPDPAIMALRVLRAINTPSAREAAKAYVKGLQEQLRFADEILAEFGPKAGG
jgi:HEAT repeat protein